MTYMDLQALRHYVYQTQKIIYELVAVSLSSVINANALTLRINKSLAKVYTVRDKPIRRERRIER